MIKTAIAMMVVVFAATACSDYAETETQGKTASAVRNPADGIDGERGEDGTTYDDEVPEDVASWEAYLEELRSQYPELEPGQNGEDGEDGASIGGGQGGKGGKGGAAL